MNKRLFLGLSSLLLVCCTAWTAQERPTNTLHSVTDNCETGDMQYIILSNEQRSETTRYIKVFLNNKDFTLAKLKVLFLHLSRSNPDPKVLAIVVETDWSRLNLPTDCTGSGYSGEERYASFKFNTARFNRDAKSSTIHYTKEPNVDRLDVVEVAEK